MPGSATDPTALYRLRDGIYAADLLIVAIAELDLFTHVARAGSVDVAELCAEWQLDARPVDVMLTYFASLRERPGCADLLSVLRTGRPADWAGATGARDWGERLAEAEFAATFTAAMDARAAFLGPALAGALADVPARRVLDVAGGSGAYARALVDRAPDGHGDRIDVVAGDMFADPLPPDHDVHLFSHVLHDWGEPQVRQLLSASFAALTPGGWLVDHDAHLNEAKTGSLPVAEYSVLLMHSTPGKCWSLGEMGAMLDDAGFTGVASRSTAGDRSAILARKPG